VSVNTTSAPSAHRRPVFVDCHRRWLGIDRQCTHSLHRNDMAYCHYELCRDCGLGCFSESLLADIRRLSVVFLYQMSVFYNKISVLELYFSDSMQTVYARGGACGGGGSQQREVADGADVVFTDTGSVGRTSLSFVINTKYRWIKYNTHVHNASRQHIIGL